MADDHISIVGKKRPRHRQLIFCVHIKALTCREPHNFLTCQEID